MPTDPVRGLKVHRTRPAKVSLVVYRLFQTTNLPQPDSSGFGPGIHELLVRLSNPTTSKPSVPPRLLNSRNTGNYREFA